MPIAVHPKMRVTFNLQYLNPVNLYILDIFIVNGGDMEACNLPPSYKLKFKRLNFIEDFPKKSYKKNWKKKLKSM